MATASNLKEKVTKILTIVEGVDVEHVNLIEKDILLQEVRELYSDILLMKTDGSAVVEPVAEEKKETVVETPSQVEEKPSEPPVIAIPFDAGDFDFHDLLSRDEEPESPKEVEPVVEEPAPEPAEEQVVVEEQKVSVEDKEEIPNADIEEIAEVDAADDEPQAEDGYFEESSASSEFDDDEPMDDDDADDEPVDELVEEPNEVEAEEIVDDVQEDIEPETEPEPEDIQEETVADMPVAEPAMPAPTESVPMPEREPEKQETVHLTLGEQLGQSRQGSLNDRFANNKPIDLSSRIGLKPITDIKAAIGLGERYRFTRMLFSGNGAAFDSTVTTLNGMSNVEEAENYLRTTYNWDMESPIVSDFMNIVRRRYL
ncbi:MAG: hypothetical protein J5709_10745 [Bacteroidales bacterium]|nr:hypothetical protein [Bacteroidales bacterium]